MTQYDLESPPAGFGSYRDAEELQKWSFWRRTPQQRLDWVVAALTIKYEVQSLPGPAERSAPREGER